MKKKNTARRILTNLKIRCRHGDQEEQNDIDKQIEGLSQLKHRETDSQAW